jgi:hypothetical protein
MVYYVKNKIKNQVLMKKRGLKEPPEKIYSMHIHKKWYNIMEGYENYYCRIVQSA